ncbi:type IV pilin protein [Veronia nyctiphanis]|nr:type IV pilin protein [Veronia nyctiphanis]
MFKRHQCSAKGMTLLELLIVIGVIGALSAIAVPSYTNHLIKAERGRAQSGLYQLQVWVEQQYTENGAYPNALSCARCQLSEEYTFSIDTSGTGDDIYKLTATPKSDTRQEDDKCHTLIINAVTSVSNRSKGGQEISSDNCWI